MQSLGKDRGASFTVTLDVLKEDAPVSAAPAESTPVSARSLALLLVDDHPDTLRVIARLLRKRGHRVSTADSVRAALQLLSAEQFDALISDIGLPDGSGYDLMREAKLHQVLRGVAISGFGMEEDVRRSMEAGFDRHLTKPVDFGEIEKFLAEVAQQARTQSS